MVSVYWLMIPANIFIANSGGDIDEDFTQLLIPLERNNTVIILYGISLLAYDTCIYVLWSFFHLGSCNSFNGICAKFIYVYMIL